LLRVAPEQVRLYLRHRCRRDSGIFFCEDAGTARTETALRMGVNGLETPTTPILYFEARNTV
jgi:hypothetical protein